MSGSKKSFVSWMLLVLLDSSLGFVWMKIMSNTSFLFMSTTIISLVNDEKICQENKTSRHNHQYCSWIAYNTNTNLVILLNIWILVLHLILLMKCTSLDLVTMYSTVHFSFMWYPHEEMNAIFIGKSHIYVKIFTNMHSLLYIVHSQIVLHKAKLHQGNHVFP